MAAAEAGARSELARAGMLASCSPSAPSACPAVLMIDVVRLEEESAGIAAADGMSLSGSPSTSSPSPLGRGLRLTVTGRARLLVSGASVARDTGDVRSTFVLSRGDGDAAALTPVREQAVRHAARRLGERLARRILGVPDPSDE
jgi:hypothetical protein